MRISGSQKFSAPKEIVWDYMNNKDILARCIPGCKEMRVIGTDEYESQIEMGIAAIKGSYQSRTRLTNKQYPETFTLVINAEGAMGIVNATAHVHLSELLGDTTANYEGEAQIGGLIAGVGQRMLSGVAKLIIGQFFKSMAKEILSSSGAVG